MIFRTSFSISMFFLTRALLSRFGWVQPRRRAIKILIWVEIPVLIALLVGSFYIPSSACLGFQTIELAVQFADHTHTHAMIFSIVSVSYQIRDTLLNKIENAEKSAEGAMGKGSCAGSFCVQGLLSKATAHRKTAFLGVCAGSLVAVGAGIAYLVRHSSFARHEFVPFSYSCHESQYMRFSDCSLGLAFTTITIVAAGLLTSFAVRIHDSSTVCG
ncbi:hypothetical protein GQ600_18016 [Phytophthora cactorum]|nr:hypothetical protein GQ600_18016 [Phytophthora cactorum]